MSEIPTPVEIGEQRIDVDEQILEILEKGKISHLVPIEEVLDDVPLHDNIVKHGLADPTQPMNVVEELEVRLHRKKLRAIFKPEKGVNREVRNEAGIESFGEREAAAYETSRHFGFGIVPPTTLRDIPDEGPGSIREFVDDKKFVLARDLPPEIGFDEFTASKGFQELAAFDWMVANWDRKQIDYFFGAKDTNQVRAIDNGFALDDMPYWKADIRKIRGPHYLLTYDDNDQRPRTVHLPEEMKSKIAQGLENQSALTTKLRNLNIPDYDIGAFIKRTEALLKYGVFLSRKNTRKEPVSQEIELIQ